MLSEQCAREWQAGIAPACTVIHRFVGFAKAPCMSLPSKDMHPTMLVFFQPARSGAKGTATCPPGRCHGA